MPLKDVEFAPEEFALVAEPLPPTKILSLEDLHELMRNTLYFGFGIGVRGRERSILFATAVRMDQLPDLMRHEGFEGIICYGQVGATGAKVNQIVLNRNEDRKDPESLTLAKEVLGLIPPQSVEGWVGFRFEGEWKAHPNGFYYPGRGEYKPRDQN